MPETDSNRRTAQARHAAAVRWHKANQAEMARDFAYARLQEYIRQTVEKAPLLTEQQRDSLALLLRGSSDSGGATR